MNKKIYITGDTHGAVVPRINQLLANKDLIPEETALVILGDAGLNYYLDRRDYFEKQEAESKGVYLYCVRGNHEARPGENLDMELIHDETVGGPVWVEKEYPHIRYFTDWGIYNIQGLKTLVVGGAYSVDKYYRLQRGFRWFENEQLKDFERKACLRGTKMQEFDFVLSHTCPFSWQPTDLFLGFIDQSMVDNTMEKWMDELAENIIWKNWLFGHYHIDRIELPHVECFYTDIEALDDIAARWERYDKTGELDWWISLSPKMNKTMEGE